MFAHWALRVTPPGVVGGLSQCDMVSLCGTETRILFTLYSWSSKGSYFLLLSVRNIFLKFQGMKGLPKPPFSLCNLTLSILVC